MTAKNLKITQGELVFDIRAENRHAWIIRELMRRWRSFTTDVTPVDVDVSIACYDFKKKIAWPADRIEPFKRMFREVLDRFPFSNGDPDTTCRPENILTQLDPETRSVKQVANRLQQDGGVIFANTATGLFFFLPSERKLFIFSRTAPPPFPFLSRFYSKPSQSRAVLLADIANGVMLAFSWLLVRNGGLLLHGAGVTKSGFAVLFLGLSGAGKSTAASKCAADACFSDDGVIVKIVQNRIYIYPSIFTQSPGYWRRPLPLPVELRKLFLLNKSDQNHITLLDKNLLTNDILLHLIHFFRYLDKKTAKKAFENTLTIVASLPAYRLDFTKNWEDWNEIWKAPAKRKSMNHRS